MKLLDINPPQELHTKIVARIVLRETRIAHTKMFVMGIFSASSLTALVFAIQYTAQELSQSGFTQYLSLVFSDSGTLMTLWREFALSLADSVPIAGIIIVLSSVAVFLASVKGVITNSPKIKHNYGY